MGRRRKHKKHAKKTTQAKEEPANRQDEQKQIRFRHVIGHARSSGWVQNSGTGFLFTLIALIVAVVLKVGIKAAAITFALAGTAFVWIVAAVTIKSSIDEQPPFKAQILGLFKGEKRDSARFVCQYNNFLTPAPIVLYMRIVNNQDIPATIDSFKIEVKREERSWLFIDMTKWLPTVSIPESMPTIFLNPPPNPAMGTTFMPPDRLETIFRNTTIPPHATVSGWVFLDVPAEYDDVPQPLTFRISLRDTAGVKGIIADSEPTKKDINISPQYGITFTQPVNIDGLQLRHWADSQIPYRAN